MKLNFNTVLLVFLMIILVPRMFDLDNLSIESILEALGMERVVVSDLSEPVLYDKMSNELVPTNYMISYRLIEEEGGPFPVITFLVWFKETSLCRCDYSSSKVSMCCPELIDNCHNYFGMKVANYRKNLQDGECDWNEDHARYDTPVRAIRDFVMRNEHWMRAKNIRPKSNKEFIEFLRESGYNPYDSYYDRPRGGLYSLLEKWENDTFWDEYLDEYLAYIKTGLEVYQKDVRHEF